MYINGLPILNVFYVIGVGMCIQVPTLGLYYTYLKRCRRFFKKKIASIKHTAWLFFMQRERGLEDGQKQQKRKKPKFLFLFFLYRLGIPRNLEVDYTTTSVFLLFRFSGYLYTSYYLNKLFSFKMFSQYNFKKLN